MPQAASLASPTRMGFPPRENTSLSGTAASTAPSKLKAPLVGTHGTISVSMVDRNGAAPAPRRRADSTRSANCQPGIWLQRLWEDNRQRRNVCRLSMTSALSLSGECWSPGELGPLAVVAEESAAGETQIGGWAPAHASAFNVSETAPASGGGVPPGLPSTDLLEVTVPLHDPKTPVSQGARTGWPRDNLQKRFAGCGAAAILALPPSSLDADLATALCARRGVAETGGLRPRIDARFWCAKASS